MKRPSVLSMYTFEGVEISRIIFNGYEFIHVLY